MLENIYIKNQLSGIALTNLTEFIFNTQIEKKLESQFWFKFTQKYYEKNDPLNMDRTAMLLGWLCSTSGNNEIAIELLRKVYES